MVTMTFSGHKKFDVDGTVKFVMRMNIQRLNTSSS
jgi:hypothetical protein